MTRGKTGQAASALAALLLMAAVTMATEPLRVLILSGANNHDWKSTTPVLRQLIETCPRFKVIDVIEDPSQVTAELLNGCDVIASNWSAYPEMAGHQWGEKAERDFVDWVKAGHGFVVFHAASATSQDWPAFQQLVKLTWGIDKTSHGAYHTLKVTVRDSDHPITRGMRDFWITDELWHNMVNLTGQEVRAVCEAFSEPDFGGTGKFEPVVVPTALGEGRGLNIVLGHDARAMKNIGWQTLMLRGLEWAATGDVTIPIPEDWPQTASAALITGLDLDVAIRGVAAYRDGQAREPLGLVQQWAAYANSLTGPRREETRRDLADRLVILLTPDAAREVKGFVCDRLAEVGCDTHVPAIAMCLGDERVSISARNALMHIGSAAAGEALRSALSSTQGLPRLGVIHSLGQLRDSQSAALLINLLGDNDVQVAGAAALALGELGTVACADALMKVEADKIGRDVISQALVTCADRLAAAADKADARQVYEALSESSSAGIRGAALRGLAACGSDDAIVTAMTDQDRPVRRLGMQLLRESLGPDNVDEKIAAWFANMVARTTDVERRKAILSQLPWAPGISALNLAVEVMKKDEAVREVAAEAAARIGQDLAASERDVVKLTMQQVIAVSRNVDTIKLADAALREAARSVNLARNATVSSPDGLEPDGGSGPDAAAVDGNLATYWDETDDQPLYRFQVSFAKPTKVNTVVIIGHAYQSHSPKDFEVLCDNKVVKSVYDVDTGREPTSYVPLPAGPRRLSWRKDESSLALLNYSRVVWALHYGRETAKPYFDPLGLIDGVSLVWNSPPDHPWHHGLWFSWKGINGVNYWEEDGGTGRAEGLTEVVSAKVSTRDDFSARVELDLAYHQPDEPPVLRETRIMNISAPDEQGGYTIDWRGTFQAANQDLLLQGGTAGGGYAGLSARIAGDTRDWRLMDGDGREDVPGADPLAKNLHGQHARWMDLSLVHVGSGQAAGLAILEHPTSLRHPTQWHCVLEDKIPFGYFSPSPLWSEPYTLKAGGTFVLAYQVVVHPQRLSGAELERRWKEFAQGKE
jgi:type 1 glutamine amidotransferase/HEAT repeat protein